MAAALGFGAFTSFADTVTTTSTTTHSSWWSERMSYQRDCEKYSANELDLDLFGTYSHPLAKWNDMFDRSWRHGQWGGGVGMSYFLTRNIGIGVDTFFQEHGHFFNNVSGDVIARFPISNSGFAPYLYGGAGWRDGSSVGANLDELTAHGGVGIEYRFNPHLGVFIDARYTWTDKTADESLVRSGFRIGLH